MGARGHAREEARHFGGTGPVQDGEVQLRRHLPVLVEGLVVAVA